MTIDPGDEQPAKRQVSGVACLGWRAVPHAGSSTTLPWHATLGANRMYDMPKGGNIGGAEYYYARVQHLVSSAPNMTWGTFALKYPERATRCEEAAAKEQARMGGLYIGVKSCVRSMMCETSNGQVQLDGACHGCSALGKSPGFTRRIARSEAAGSEAPNENTNHRYATTAEITCKANGLAKEARQERFASARTKLTVEFRLEAAAQRGKAAMEDAQALLSELAAASAALSNEEQQRRRAEVQLAVAVEEHVAEVAEQHGAAVAERGVVQESLHAMALSLAAVEEELEESRRPQLRIRS